MNSCMAVCGHRRLYNPIRTGALLVDDVEFHPVPTHADARLPASASGHAAVGVRPAVATDENSAAAAAGTQRNGVGVGHGIVGQNLTGIGGGERVVAAVDGGRGVCVIIAIT